MGSDFTETLRHARNYFSAAVLQRALGIISLPVYTHLMSRAEYGTAVTFFSYVGVLIYLIPLNTHVAVARYYYEDREDFPEFLGTSLALTTFCVVAAAALFLRWKQPLQDMMAIPSDVFWMMVPLAALRIAHSTFEQIRVAQRQSGVLARLSIALTYGTFTVAVVLLLLLGQRLYRAQIWAQTAVMAAIAVYTVPKLWSEFRWRFECGHLRYILSYALPLLPYSLSGIILGQFDLMMINRSSGASQAGVYAIAYNLGMVLETVIQALNNAWSPSYMQVMNAKDYAKHDDDIDLLFRLTLAAAAVLIMLGATGGRILTARQFHEGLHLIPVVVLGYAAYSIFYIYGRHMGFAKRTVLLSGVTLAAGATNVLLNLLMIPRFGYGAAAYTTLASYSLLAVLAWVANRFLLREHSTPVKVWARPLGWTAAAVAASRALDAAGPVLWVDLPVRCGATALCVWGLLAGRVDRAELSRLLRRKP